MSEDGSGISPTSIRTKHLDFAACTAPVSDHFNINVVQDYTWPILKPPEHQFEFIRSNGESSREICMHWHCSAQQNLVLRRGLGTGQQGSLRSPSEGGPYLCRSTMLCKTQAFLLFPAFCIENSETKWPLLSLGSQSSVWVGAERCKSYTLHTVIWYLPVFARAQSRQNNSEQTILRFPQTYHSLQCNTTEM